MSFSPVDLLIHNASKSLHFFSSSFLGYYTFFIKSFKYYALLCFHILFQGGFQSILFFCFVFLVVSLECRQGFLRCLWWLQCLFYWIDAWLVNAETMISKAENRFQRSLKLRGHWLMRGFASELEVWLALLYLIGIRSGPVKLPPLPLLWKWKIRFK